MPYFVDVSGWRAFFLRQMEEECIMGREEVGKETGKSGGRENCGHDVMYERRIKN